MRCSRLASAMMFLYGDANREDRVVTSSLSLIRKKKRNMGKREHLIIYMQATTCRSEQIAAFSPLARSRLIAR